MFKDYFIFSSFTVESAMAISMAVSKVVVTLIFSLVPLIFSLVPLIFSWFLLSLVGSSYL